MRRRPAGLGKLTGREPRGPLQPAGDGSGGGGDDDITDLVAKRRFILSPRRCPDTHRITKKHPLCVCVCVFLLLFFFRIIPFNFDFVTCCVLSAIRVLDRCEGFFGWVGPGLVLGLGAGGRLGGFRLGGFRWGREEGRLPALT